ncbi:hypothetical protein Aduo_011467 [Ancylostoma duodenale]
MSEELVNPVELEALLLDEPTQSEQLASMIATLDKLMQTVQGIAKQNVAQVSQHYVPAPSTLRSGEASIIYAQLNTDEFRNVEYHLEFDPIAAAQGELRGLQPLNPKVLKQSNPSAFQREKTSSPPQTKVRTSPSPRADPEFMMPRATR